MASGWTWNGRRALVLVGEVVVGNVMINIHKMINPQVRIIFDPTMVAVVEGPERCGVCGVVVLMVFWWSGGQGDEGPTLLDQR